MWPALVVAVLTLALLWLWLWCRSTFDYWRRRGVPTLQPCRPPFGHLGDALLLTPLVDIIQRLYRATDEPYVGVYMLGSPVLLVNSPELIQRVLVSDFGHFTARGFSAHRDYDPLAENIIHIDDRQLWKRIRSKLTSPFSLNKVKAMVTKIDDSAEDVVQIFSRSCQAGKSVHATQLANRYMIDTILSCAFGIKGNAVLDPNSEFRLIGEVTFGVRFVMHIFIGLFFPRLHKVLGLTVASKKVTKFFLRLAKEAQRARESDTNAKDFLHALLQMKEQDEKDRREGLNTDQAVIDDEFVAAQMFMFFGAGFESPGNTVAFCLHELALHPELQEKAWREVSDVLSRHAGQLTYETLQDMTFMEKFLLETQRKYPVLTLVFRRCTKEYQLPGGKASIEAGTTVLIPTAAIQHDPSYYPSPERFDPERFSEANIAARHPATFIPFGAGPRNCPAVVYTVVQMKVVLIRILQHFEFTLEAPVPDPLPVAPFNFLLCPKEEVKLRATLRTA